MSAGQAAALVALQAALEAAFRADATLSGLVSGRIHDGTPKAAVTPYLAFAEARASDWSGGETTGARLRLTLEAVATDGERGRAMAIVGRASELAVSAPPVLGEGTMVLIRERDTGVERSKDGRTWRARVMLEALVDG